MISLSAGAGSLSPIDSHRADSLVFRPLKKGIVPTIPLCAMIPEVNVRMIVAGRAMSGDGEAHSAFRAQATRMATGQAAGAAAALVVKNGCGVDEMPSAYAAENGVERPRRHCSDIGEWFAVFSARRRLCQLASGPYRLS